MSSTSGGHPRGPRQDSTSSGSKPTQSAVDPREYIRVMEEKNKILKRLNEKASSRHKGIEEREKGFNVYFQGANSAKHANPHHPHSTSSSSSSSSSHSQQQQQQQQHPERRKNWSHSSAKKNDILQGLTSKRSHHGSRTGSKGRSSSSRGHQTDSHPLSSRSSSTSPSKSHHHHRHSSQRGPSPPLSSSPTSGIYSGQASSSGYEEENGNIDEISEQKRKNWLKNSLVLMTTDGKGIPIKSQRQQREPFQSHDLAESMDMSSSMVRESVTSEIDSQYNVEMKRTADQVDSVSSSPSSSSPLFHKGRGSGSADSSVTTPHNEREEEMEEEEDEELDLSSLSESSINITNPLSPQIDLSKGFASTTLTSKNKSKNSSSFSLSDSQSLPRRYAQEDDTETGTYTADYFEDGFETFADEEVETASYGDEFDSLTADDSPSDSNSDGEVDLVRIRHSDVALVRNTLAEAERRVASPASPHSVAESLHESFETSDEEDVCGDEDAAVVAAEVLQALVMENERSKTRQNTTEPRHSRGGKTASSLNEREPQEEEDGEEEDEEEDTRATPLSFEQRENKRVDRNPSPVDLTTSQTQIRDNVPNESHGFVTSESAASLTVTIPVGGKTSTKRESPLEKMRKKFNSQNPFASPSSESSTSRRSRQSGGSSSIPSPSAILSPSTLSPTVDIRHASNSNSDAVTPSSTKKRLVLVDPRNTPTYANRSIGSISTSTTPQNKTGEGEREKSSRAGPQRVPNTLKEKEHKPNESASPIMSGPRGLRKRNGFGGKVSSAASRGLRVKTIRDEEVDEKSVSSLDSPTMQALLHKVKSLGSTQRSYLVGLLERLESGDKKAISPEVLRSLESIRSPTKPPTLGGVGGNNSGSVSSRSPSAPWSASHAKRSSVSREPTGRSSQQQQHQRQVNAVKHTSSLPSSLSTSSLSTIPGGVSASTTAPVASSSTSPTSLALSPSPSPSPSSGRTSSLSSRETEGEKMLLLQKTPIRKGRSPSSHRNELPIGSPAKTPARSRQNVRQSSISKAAPPQVAKLPPTGRRSRNTSRKSNQNTIGGGNEEEVNGTTNNTSGANSNNMNNVGEVMTGRSKKNMSLEESWDSLEFFQQTHLGRVEKDTENQYGAEHGGFAVPLPKVSPSSEGHQMVGSGSSTFSPSPSHKLGRKQPSPPSSSSASSVVPPAGSASGSNSRNASNVSLPSLVTRSISDGTHSRKSSSTRTGRRLRPSNSGNDLGSDEISSRVSGPNTVPLSSSPVRKSVSLPSFLPPSSNTPGSVAGTGSGYTNSVVSNTGGGVNETPVVSRRARRSTLQNLAQRIAASRNQQGNTSRHNSGNSRHSSKNSEANHLIPFSSSTSISVGRRSPSPVSTSSDDGQSVSIPLLPRGRQLVLDIQSTWGDRHYVGLCGIECFDESGQLISFDVPSEQVIAEPGSVNILVKGGGGPVDPRVASNLIDGVNCTSDDLHMWLAPYTPGGRHTVTLTFNCEVGLSMIRVWNYNKSRIHSFRGVRDVEILLDDTPIFAGEIRRAPGNVSDCIKKSEVILFTSDEEILQVLESHPIHVPFQEDETNNSEDSLMRTSIEIAKQLESQRPLTGEAIERPATSVKSREVVTEKCMLEDDQMKSLASGGAERTGRTEVGELEDEDAVHTDLDEYGRERSMEHGGRPGDLDVYDSSSLSLFTIEGREVKILIQTTWGDANFVGLTGISVLDDCGEEIELSPELVTAYPRDINDVPGHSGDTRTLDKLLDHHNITMDDNHMWLAPYIPSQQWMKLELPRRTHVSGLRVWNYNKNDLDTYRGVRSVDVFVDNVRVSPAGGFVFRKAPGSASFDFGQTIWFVEPNSSPTSMSSSSSSSSSSLRNGSFSLEALRTQKFRAVDEYILPSLPTGFILKLVLFSSWGDPHYIGLNGLELFDEEGLPISIPEGAYSAIPSSITELAPMQNDVRTLDKLFDSINNTWDDHHMWLSPLLKFPPSANTIYIAFDAPISLSVIKVWNYSKSPERGCKDIQIFLDDELLFDGILRKAPSSSGGAGRTPVNFAQSIIFSQSKAIVEREMHNAFRWEKGTEQDICFINDNVVVSRQKSKGKKSYPTARPTTAFTERR